MNRRGIAIVGLLALLVTGVLLGTTGTLAGWTDTATVGTKSDAFSSGAIAPPTVRKPAQKSGGHHVELSWDEVSVGTAGAKATAYEIRRFTAATGGGDGDPVCTTTGATSCVDATDQKAPVHYALRARFGENWVQDSPRVQHVPDVTGPQSVAVRGPRDGFTAFPILMSTHLGNQCDDREPVYGCGTVSSEADVRVEYRMKRWRTRWLRDDYEHACWIPRSKTWQSVSASALCDWAPASVGGAHGWFLPGPSQDVYPVFETLREHLLEVRAIDRFGNIGAVARSEFTG